MRRVLKVLGLVVVAGVLVLALLYVLRTDPIGPLSGKRLSGSEAAFPTDWTFSDAFELVAVEVRPDDPHSVTTLGFVHDGALHIPAAEGSTKDWTGYVLADPRVRVKVGGIVYPALAERVTEFDAAAMRRSLGAKYPDLVRDSSATTESAPLDFWLFRIVERSP